MNKKTIVLIFSILTLAAAAFAANLANPATQVSDARMSFGVSYYIGGADITDYEIPMMMNRVCGRVSYAPIRYVNFGLDFGTTQISVDKYSLNDRDTVPVFEGRFGGVIGGHLKLTSPYFGEYVALLGIGNVNYFRSTNKPGAFYGGVDVAVAAGAQLRIPNIGYLSAGPQIYYIAGENKAFNSKEKGKYSPVNNVRAFIAFDYFPEDAFIMWDHKPYVSIEFTASPKINGSKRAPIREFSFSVSIGAITQRLYGEDTGIEY